MTLLQLLNKYSEPVLDSMVDGFKPSYITASNGYYELKTNYMIPIFSFCYDNRRGIWINKFIDNNDVKFVQICAGREGDDAILTLVTDREWFVNFLDTYDLIIEIDALLGANMLRFISLDDEIDELVKNEISSYGTPYEDTTPKILDILKIEG